MSRHSSVPLRGCCRDVWALKRSYREILEQQNDASTIFSGHYQRTYRQKNKIKRVKTVTVTVKINYGHAIRNNSVNPLNPELNPICYSLALLAHHFLHVIRIRVKSLTVRLLMSYIYGAPILDVSRSHTTTHHSR